MPQPVVRFCPALSSYWRKTRGTAVKSFSFGLQRSLPSFGPATRVELVPLSVGNDRRGLWADLSAESRNRGTEVKGLSPRPLRSVDTPLREDCGSYLIPFTGRIPKFVRRPIGHGRHPKLRYYYTYSTMAST